MQLPRKSYRGILWAVPAVVLGVAAAALAAGTGTMTASSTSSAVVIGVNPTNTTRPTIAGTAQVGQTLTGGLGTWTDAQWFRWQYYHCPASGPGCLAIATSTSDPTTGTTTDPAAAPTYLLQASDAGFRIRLLVTAYDYPQSTSAVSR